MTHLPSRFNLIGKKRLMHWLIMLSNLSDGLLRRPKSEPRLSERNIRPNTWNYRALNYSLSKKRKKEY
jgi:hypothetical protein